MLNDLSHYALTCVVQQLDSGSAASLARVSKQMRAICVVVHGLGILELPFPAQAALLPPVMELSNSMASPSFSSASSSSSHHADYDSLGSTDTDMTSSPEEEEWEFQITPDLERRLSLIPSRSHGNTLPTLPTELQLEVFSYLDKIDSCCLGLSAPNLYLVYRAIHGTKMPLNTRRIGPNPLEAAWEVVGKRECKQCGIYRCELHQHIKSWMPKELEYCAFKQNFGIPAGNNAHASCYRGKPSKPKRCGRHPLRTTSVHQDDATFKY
ncbi:hypothetical protein F5882DRAFT_32973 [Hyaloscypha sp. PMI_1271]|nr:hypothetical protein F5882DRAFT_32973 [Hyaloscypha sp. PMI_1271]